MGSVIDGLRAVAVELREGDRVTAGADAHAPEIAGRAILRALILTPTGSDEPVLTAYAGNAPIRLVAGVAPVTDVVAMETVLLRAQFTGDAAIGRTADVVFAD